MMATAGTPRLRVLPQAGLRLCLASGLAVAFSAWLVLASIQGADAASPLPSTPPAASAPPGIIETGDPRSNGQGPGLVGSPFAILAGVVFLGMATAGGTLLYLRVTRRD